MVSMKVFAVHLPRPVSRSGVRLAVKLTPQPPAYAVLVAPTEVTHGPLAAGAGGISKPSGWPDSARDMSGFGPCSVMCHGVWQSWQPAVLTRYLPRDTASVTAPLGAGSAARANE